ncbi:type II toxin-antitoxin system VapC family toxin [Candidatus Collierbacteria bacterium]|nr:type II toxin-antitoxin system VapC family toxin [Candidatus Collierbacteria bacterium]
MAKYLADTNILIAHLRGDARATEFLANKSSAISAVTVAELIQGCRNPRQLIQTNTLISSFEVLHIDYPISALAIKFVLDLYLSHGLKFLDAVIAATAIKHKLILKTQDARHFKFIKGLAVV